MRWDGNGICSTRMVHLLERYLYDYGAIFHDGLTNRPVGDFALYYSTWLFILVNNKRWGI